MSNPFWPQQKVLVTGGSGFLGNHLCRRLVDSGAEVHATSRVERVQRDAEPHWWQADLAEMDVARRFVSEIRPDIIYHLAGSVTAVPGKEFVLPTFHSLLTSTVNLLVAATEIDCRRVILCGSLNEPQAQQGEVTPSSPYAAAKWAASGYGRMFQALYGTPTVILRTYMTYGPGQDARKLIPSVIGSLLNGVPPRLSSGAWSADWIYVDDVIEGFLSAAHRPNIEGATLDLGSGQLRTVRSIVEQIAATMHSSIQPQLGVLPDRPFAPQCLANTGESLEKLGWQPATSFETGLRQTVEWYRANRTAFHSNT